MTTSLNDGRSAAPVRPGAPFLIGVTGKRDLRDQDHRVRDAVDRAFDLVDRHLPDTPKIVLSALASGADSIAAEAALARDGWRVVAPLPFRRDLYESDFLDATTLDRLRSLLADPRVDVVELSPLRRRGSKGIYSDRELVRTARADPERTLHYEQAGLYIMERCALLLGIVGPEDTPGLIGGAARILEARLCGVDATALDVRHRSAELLQEGGLADPRCGPVWRVLLEPDGARADKPLQITVQLPDRPQIPTTGRDSTIVRSLELGLRLDDFNRRASRLERERSTADPPDGVARLAGLRRSLSLVQHRMKARVQWSVWSIAALFTAAVTLITVHGVFEGYAWTGPLSVFYFLFAAATVSLYVLAGRRRWQPLAEDYRAMSEALRAQMVLWQSGLTEPGFRVDLQYLRGKDGALGLVRETIGQFVEGARLSAAQPPCDPTAAETWVEAQLSYFSHRIRARDASVGFARAASWFLFGTALTLSACVAGMQLEVFGDLVERIATAPWTVTARWSGLGIAASLTIACFVAAQVARRRAEAARRTGADGSAYRVLGLGAAVAAGLLLAFALSNVAALLPLADAVGPGHGARVAKPEDLLTMGAVMATTVAGSIRFVADKLSWEAELEGYEDALGFFTRARRSLTALADAPSATSAEREALILELVTEALRENEAWLMAHRERPLEPLLGG